MKCIVFIISLIFSLNVKSQEVSWKIRLNGKTLVNTNIENEQKNTFRISASEWKKPGKLEISFKETDKGMWKRSVFMNDENDNQLITKDSVTTVSISLQELRKAFKNKKKLIIYTAVSPVNPDIAIRIRRVHLCTLRLP